MSSTFDRRNINHGIAGPLVCGAIAVVAVVGRLVSRGFTTVTYSWDDWFAVVAVVFFVGLVSLEVWAIEKAGWLLDPADIPAEKLPLFFKADYVGPLLSVNALAFAKYSILFFYHRVFAVKRDFKIALWAITALCIGIHLVESFVVLFQCVPVRAGWDYTLRGEAFCINLVLFTVIIESFNCLSEVLMGILPIRSVYRLHSPFRHRLGLILIFGLGYFTAIISIVRIIQTWWPTAVSVDLTSSTIWTDIQIMVAILAGSLPMYRKVLPERLDTIPAYIRSALDHLVSSRSSRRSKSSDDSRDRATAAGASMPTQDIAMMRLPKSSNKPSSSLKEASVTELRLPSDDHPPDSRDTRKDETPEF